MKWVILLLVLAVAGIGVYAYKNNPTGCAKLGADLAADVKADVPGIVDDVTTIFTSNTAAPDATNSKGAKLPAKGSTAPAGATPKGATNSTDGTPTAPSAGASDASPATASTPAPPSWTPPAKIPAQPNWTWSTPQGTFTWVHILKVEADRVTILHMQGQAVIPMSDLPPDLQKRLNYDPSAAMAAAAARGNSRGTAVAQPQEAQPAATPPPVVAQATPTPTFTETTNYQDALVEARRTKKKVLLHFTGSDWCYYCKMLEQEVMSRSEFRQYAEANYITVTLDFPHDFPLSSDLKQQNDALAQKFGVHGYPTLLVLDSDEKELGRISGYNPGSGPSSVIDSLKPFTQ